MAGSSTPGSARLDVDAVRTWNGPALDAVRTNRATDADAARLYAMLNVAVYDAVHGVAGTRPARAHALVPSPGPWDADPQAAAVTAAHAVLVHLNPTGTPDYDARRDADLAALRGGPAVARGAAWGGRVGAAVATVATKYAYRHWRPTTAIREADTDGNPVTAPDPLWSARAGSAGGTPEYVSGHRSYSAAGAAALAGFFCADAVPFSHVTDSAPGGAPRNHPGFAAAATEAGRSRVYGGQHFEFGNQAGLAVGRGGGRRGARHPVAGPHRPDPRRRLPALNGVTSR